MAHQLAIAHPSQALSAPSMSHCPNWLNTGGPHQFFISDFTEIGAGAFISEQIFYGHEQNIRRTFTKSCNILQKVFWLKNIFNKNPLLDPLLFANQPHVDRDDAIIYMATQWRWGFSALFGRKPGDMQFCTPVIWKMTNYLPYRPQFVRQMTFLSVCCSEVLFSTLRFSGDAIKRRQMISWSVWQLEALPFTIWALTLQTMVWC